MKRLFSVILTLLVLVSGITSCEPTPVPAPIPTPAPSKTPIITTQYPANISGHVIIAEKLMVNGREDITCEENDVFWLVNISVENKNYEHPITAEYNNWVIVVGSDTYQVATILRVIEDESSPINIPLGSTGQLIMGFCVPHNLTLRNAEVRYNGQKPYSYGKLIGGDKVIAYDWDSKKVLTGKEEPELQAIEPYLVHNPMEPTDKTMMLKTIGFWKGNESRQIVFEVDKSPSVINLGYTKTSQISTSFRLLLRSSSEAKAGMPGYWVAYNGYILYETGEYDIQVKASGVEWWIKIGVEP